MIKLESKQQLSTISSASQLDLEPARRLIVLIPSLEIDFTAVTSRVWELANTTGAHVQFLGLYSDATQEPRSRRELVTMSAMVRADKVSAEADVIFGEDWVDVVKTHFQPGDMVVCFAEQRVGSSHKPLSEVLQSDLDIPLYVLSGLYEQNDSRSNWLAQTVVWIGSILIIFGFFILQVRIDHLGKDWVHILLLLLSIPFEVGMIWAWNSLFK